MNKKLEVGDIILVSGTSFLPKGIQFFMNIYRKKKGLPKRKLYNHVAVVVDLWGNKAIGEAQAKGIQIIGDADKYVNGQDCLVLTWKKPLTVKEKNKFSMEAISKALIPTRYDVLNFFYQMRYVLTGKWKGPKGEKSEKRLYCSEYAAVLMDDLRNCFKGETWDKNPLDIELSKCLKVKE